MFSLLKTKTEFGIKLFWILELSIAKYKGLTTDSYTLLIGLSRCYLALKIGKEKKDAKKTKQKLKESKGYDAFA